MQNETDDAIIEGPLNKASDINEISLGDLNTKMLNPFIQKNCKFLIFFSGLNVLKGIKLGSV